MINIITFAQVVSRQGSSTTSGPDRQLWAERRSLQLPQQRTGWVAAREWGPNEL